MSLGRKCPKCGIINKPRKRVCWWCEDDGLRDVEPSEYGDDLFADTHQQPLKSRDGAANDDSDMKRRFKIVAKYLLYILGFMFGLSGTILVVNGLIYTNDPMWLKWLIIGSIQVFVSYRLFQWAKKLRYSTREQISVSEN